MKIHKSTYQQMDELFKDAQHEKPVIGLNEVEKIIKTGAYFPAPGGGSRFRIGMNTIIVVSSIVITSLLTFFTLRIDHQSIDSSKQVAVNSQVQQTVQQVAPVQNSVSSAQQSAPLTNTQSTNVNSVDAQREQQLVNKQEPLLTKADKERPAANPAKLFASKENAVIANKAEVTHNATVNENEIPVPAANFKVPPMNTNSLRVDANVGFVYNDQNVAMKFSGDDVTLLAIEDRIIPKEEYSDYDDVIAEGKDYLAGQRLNSDKNSSLVLIAFFDTQLRSDKILPGDTQYMFELTSSQLLINKIAQSDDVFKKYKKLYEDKTGKVVTEGSDYKFEKGAKSE